MHILLGSLGTLQNSIHKSNMFSTCTYYVHIVYLKRTLV